MADCDITLLTCIFAKVEGVSGLSASCLDILANWNEVGNVSTSSAYIYTEYLFGIARILSPSNEANLGTNQGLRSNNPVVRSEGTATLDVAIRRKGGLYRSITKSQVPNIPVLTITISVNGSPALGQITSCNTLEVFFNALINGSLAVTQVVSVLTSYPVSSGCR